MIPDLPQALKQLQRIDIVIVCEVDNPIQVMPFNMLQGSVALVDAPVLDFGRVPLADKMAVHDSRPPEQLGCLHRRGSHLHHDPQQGLGNQPECLPQTVEVVCLKSAVVSWGHHNEQLPRRGQGVIIIVGNVFRPGPQLKICDALGLQDLDGSVPAAEIQLGLGVATEVGINVKGRWRGSNVKGEVLGTQTVIVIVIVNTGEGGKTKQETSDEEE